jgi:hypothetical protein
VSSSETLDGPLPDADLVPRRELLEATRGATWLTRDDGPKPHEETA